MTSAFPELLPVPVPATPWALSHPCCESWSSCTWTFSSRQLQQSPLHHALPTFTPRSRPGFSPTRDLSGSQEWWEVSCTVADLDSFFFPCGPISLLFRSQGASFQPMNLILYSTWRKRASSAEFSSRPAGEGGGGGVAGY